MFFERSRAVARVRQTQQKEQGVLRSIELALQQSDAKMLSGVMGSFFLRLSQATSLMDVNTAAGIAEQELEEWAANGQAENDVFKAV